MSTAERREEAEPYDPKLYESEPCERCTIPTHQHLGLKEHLPLHTLCLKCSVEFWEQFEIDKRLFDCKGKEEYKEKYPEHNERNCFSCYIMKPQPKIDVIG